MTAIFEQIVDEEAPPSTEPRIEVEESTEEYGRFVIEPLEQGFGVTLGNSLRRVLLGSLTSAAITSVRIEGVQHEYSTIPMVKEDVSELLLNVKAVRIKPLSDRPGTLRLEVQGPGQVTAGDIQPSADFEIVNPELYLASLDSAKGSLSIEFQVEIGKGYAPAAHTDDMPIGVVPVDAVFSPVQKVNYTVDKTRVGQVTDYERLVLEVWTDLTKSSQEAVREAAQVLVDAFFQFAALGQVVEGMPERQPLAHAIPADQYNMPIERLELSARTLNCLKRAKINKVGEVLEKSRSELLRIKNFGEKSLTELHERLRSLGLLPEDSEAEEAVPQEMEGAAAPGEAAPVETEAALTPAEQERPRPRETLRDLAALRTALLGDSAEATEARSEPSALPEESPESEGEDTESADTKEP